jgi:hypothetical protein
VRWIRDCGLVIMRERKGGEGKRGGGGSEREGVARADKYQKERVLRPSQLQTFPIAILLL